MRGREVGVRGGEAGVEDPPVHPHSYAPALEYGTE